MYQHILIATDGSELSHKAVVRGLALAKALGAKVTALTVESSLNEAGKVAAQGARILEQVARDANAAGVQCEIVQMIEEEADEAIVATAIERACDLIVMASHGRSGIAAMVLGSVTAKVLAQTKVSVLVCR